MKSYGILGISGSLRASSYNHFALLAAKQLMPGSMLLTIADYSAIPLYNQDDQSPATLAAVEKLRAQVASADALLIASPEYNYSVTGVLKKCHRLAIAHLAAAFQGKTGRADLRNARPGRRRAKPVRIAENPQWPGSAGA